MDSETTPLLSVATGHELSSRRPRRTLLAAGAAFATITAILLAGLAFTTFTNRNALEISTTLSRTTPTERLCGSTDDEAGYIQLPNKRDTHYFYWFFQAQHDPHTAPLAIWLTGGPGGSSFIGLLKENGPCRVDPDTLETQTNPYGWHHRANMLWLDQPTNVGFSFGPEDELVVNSTGVAENVYWFLQGFLEKHPELQGREFYITGECYAGHYIPAIAHYIHQQNQLNLPGRQRINLQGVAMGNGWTDPVLQTQHVVDLAESNEYNLTLLTQQELAQVKEAVETCAVARQTHCAALPVTNATACRAAEKACYDDLFQPVQRKHSRNRFDIRQICPGGIEDAGFCGGIPEVVAFLNQPHVRAYLQVDEARVGPWASKSDEVAKVFMASGDYSSTVMPLVSELLDAGIRVLVYVGDADFVYNWQGNLAWVQALAWRGHDAFNAVAQRPFLSRDPLQAPEDVVLINAGAVQTFENLAFIKVYNAGHMVATGQPAVALDFINRFFSNASYLG